MIAGQFETSGVYLTKRARDQNPLVDTSASASVSLADGTAYGLTINSATAQLTIEDNKLEIADAHITSEDAKLALAGSALIGPNSVDLSFDLSGLDLARLGDAFGSYVLFAGTAHLHGDMEGIWPDLQVSADGGIDKLVVNGKSFDEAAFHVDLVGDVITSANAQLRRGDQAFTISAADYERDTNCLASADVVLADISVPDLWDMVRASPYLASEVAGPVRDALSRMPSLTSGVLNGSLRITGCLDRPDGSLDLRAVNVGIDIQQIESINVGMTARRGEVALTQLLVVSGDMNIQATGDPLYKDGIIQCDVTAENLDLSRLRPWLGDRTPGGLMSAEFAVEGPGEAPAIIGSVEVVDPTFAGLAFDRLRVSTIEVSQDKIELADIILAVGAHQIVASGFLPWDWSGPGVPADKPLQLVARLDKQDLSVLGAFSGLIESARTSGLLEGRLGLA